VPPGATVAGAIWARLCALGAGRAGRQW
jgi:hypothetical protein